MKPALKDPINQSILSVSEDQLKGFQLCPISAIARKTRLKSDIVIKHIRTMLKKGVIRRVRQTLITHSLAKGALVAWKIPKSKLNYAFQFLSEKDTHSGHVVIRKSELNDELQEYCLWSTLKIPRKVSLKKHCEFLRRKIGAKNFFILPAKGVFALGVGHMRRKNISPCAKSVKPAIMQKIQQVKLSTQEKKFLNILKKEFSVDEIDLNIWEKRLQKLNVKKVDFYKIAKRLEKKGVIGRFSTFIEHKNAYGKNTSSALFAWAVPCGFEKRAGEEIGKYKHLTHCYWRTPHKELKKINILAVAHGKNKSEVLKLKRAIDKMLQKKKIPISYSNIFWSKRSSIKPSEF